MFQSIKTISGLFFFMVEKFRFPTFLIYTKLIIFFKKIRLSALVRDTEHEQKVIISSMRTLMGVAS